MSAAPFEKKAPDVVEKAPQQAPEKRVQKLTFWQKTVLTAGIIVIGGVPSALLTMGSVPARPPQALSSSGASVMSNTAPIQMGACMAPATKDQYKPTMNLQNR